MHAVADLYFVIEEKLTRLCQFCQKALVGILNFYLYSSNGFSRPEVAVFKLYLGRV